MMRSFPSGVAAVIVVALAASACGPKKVETKPPAPAPVETAKPAPTTPTPPPPPAPPPPVTADKPLTEDALIPTLTPPQLTEKGYLKPVFFAYDSIELTEEARGILQKNAEFLKKWANTRIMIEGHADSRGTNEYNLALGERRSAAVRDYITSLGVVRDRVTTVSKGEEQPSCREETEGCWQQNRRGGFIFTAGAK